MESPTPFFFSNVVMQWLESSLDYGITENEFWEMTLAELIRAIESKKRIHKEQLREKAAQDYILGDLIGKSIARIYNSSATYPQIYEVYKDLFDSEELKEQRQEQLDTLSALRFRQFANHFNKNFNGEVAKS